MDGRDASIDVLDDLLRHATGTTQPYRPYGGIPLTAFPVIGKRDIREMLEEFRSAAYDSTRVRRFLTSGSRGTPLAVWHDIEKRVRLKADVIYFNEEAGLRVGNRLMWMRA
jgi:phenylacetate-CoA ligase